MDGYSTVLELGASFADHFFCTATHTGHWSRARSVAAKDRAAVKRAGR
jgi:hypothetical protein